MIRSDKLQRRRRITKKTQLGGAEDWIDDTDDLFEEDETEDIDDDHHYIDFEQTIVDEKNVQIAKEIKEFDKGNTIEYDFTNDDFSDSGDDQDIHDVYQKIYIMKNPIFWDDTITKIKAKICDSIRLSLSTYKSNYLTPSRIYIWSEYIDQNDKLDKVMIGSKWLRRSELVTINAEPNKNLSLYSRLSTNELKDIASSFVKFGEMLRHEDDQNYILYEYLDYISNNEIYMVDLYSQLYGFNELNQNFINTYIKLYFPSTLVDFNDIREYIDNTKEDGKQEIKRMNDVYQIYHQELALERHVVASIEDVHVRKSGFDFSEPVIVQAVIQTNFYHPPQNVPLRTIYRSFTCNHTYPYVQLLMAHQTPERRVYREKSLQRSITKDDIIMISNWFKSTTYGLTIKILHDEYKFLSVTITDNGRLHYKIQYKELDGVTIDGLETTLPLISDLIKKINKESDIKLPTPDPSLFKFAFINSTQKFKPPNGITLDHNALSVFARYFYPYVAVVINPKKRQTEKSDKTSKWGTYLRYKRISNYGNVAIIHRRIVHYLRNFIISDKQLVGVIEHEFNMTQEDALKSVKHVLQNVDIQKSPVLKPASMIKHVKASGIAIEIQGKTVDTYKIRVIGARNKEQMFDIYDFLNKLIVLYYDIHHRKTKESLLKRLQGLTGIAKRKNLVQDILVHETEDVKQWTREYDADRMQRAKSYTRQCQNSGDEIRRPRPVIGSTALEKLGYRLNEETGIYEKRTKHPVTNEQVTQIAVKLIQNDKEIYYICDPSIHKERIYLGILTKTRPPLPCCFKKNQLTSKNKIIRSTIEKYLFMQDRNQNDGINHQNLYVKKFNSKSGHMRLHFLPLPMQKWLQIHSAVFYQSRLDSCVKGQYFILGLGTGIVDALAAVCHIGRTQLVDDIVSYCRKIEDDYRDAVFSYITGGTAKLRFQTIDNLVEYISNNPEECIIRDLFILAKQINVMIVDVTETDCFLRCPSYYKPQNDNCLLVVDEIGNYHIFTEVFKTPKNPEFTMNNQFSSTHHASVSIFKFLEYSCKDDRNEYLKTEILYGQILDEWYRVRFWVNKDNVLLPAYSNTLCNPELMVISNMDYLSLGQSLEEYKKRPWIRPLNLLTINNIIQALVVQVGSILNDIDYIVPVKPLDVTENYGYPIKDVTPSHNEDNRFFSINLELIKHEVFMSLRKILSQRFEANNKLRSMIVENVTSNTAKVEDLHGILKETLSDLNRLEQNSDDWAKSLYEEISSVKFQSTRLINPCLESTWGYPILCNQGKFSIPSDWYEEFLVKLTLQLIYLQVPGKEILRLDRYNVTNTVDILGVYDDRDESELTINSYMPNIKSIIKTLFGDDTTEVLEGHITTPTEDKYKMKEYEKYYVQEILLSDDIILRALTSCLYYLIHRDVHGFEINNLVASNSLQTCLVNTVKSKAITWMTHNIGMMPPTLTGLSEPIDRNVIISFHHDKVPDDRWLLSVWVFHMLFDEVPIQVLTPNDNLRYSLEGGGIYEGPQKTVNLKEGCVIRVSPAEGIPLNVESLLWK